MIRVFNKIPISGWLETRLAKLFGKKMVSYADGYRIVAYTWRGKLYVVSYQ